MGLNLFVSLPTEYDGEVWVNPDCVSSVVPVQDEQMLPKNCSLVYMVGGQTHIVKMQARDLMRRLTTRIGEVDHLAEELERLTELARQDTLDT